MGQYEAHALELACYRAVSLEEDISAFEASSARSRLPGSILFSGGVSLIGGLDARHGYAIAQRSELDAWDG